MATAEECREALQALTNRLGEMDPQDRASFFSNRSFSCYVTDLGVMFVTRITDQGAEPVKEALDNVASHDKLKVFDLLAGHVRQPLAYRCGQIAGFVFAHARDSR